MMTYVGGMGGSRDFNALATASISLKGIPPPFTVTLSLSPFVSPSSHHLFSLCYLSPVLPSSVCPGASNTHVGFMSTHSFTTRCDVDQS